MAGKGAQCGFGGRRVTLEGVFWVWYGGGLEEPSMEMNKLKVCRRTQYTGQVKDW